MKELMLVMCLSMVTGCSTLAEFVTKTSASGSYVAPEIDDADTKVITRDMTGFLSSQFPYAKTTVRLDSLKTPFHAALISELGQKGFGVTESDSPGAVSVHYAVTSLDSGVLVRMRYQGKEAARYFSRTGTGLSAGKYALREATK